MKLYTEEEVLRVLNMVSKLYKPLTVNQTIEHLTPIELPSEEDIVNKALEIQWSNTLFKDGANYVLDKIQGGNK
jgi:hypothetical protein